MFKFTGSTSVNTSKREKNCFSSGSINKKYYWRITFIRSLLKTVSMEPIPAFKGREDRQFYMIQFLVSDCVSVEFVPYLSNI